MTDGEVSDCIEPIVLQLQQLMDQREEVERQLKLAEEKRERNGVYDRFARRMLVSAQRLTREELESLVARQAADLKRASKSAQLQRAREHALLAWETYEGASGYSELSAQPTIYGRRARAARWARNDEIRQLVLRRWQEGTWRTKAAFARSIVGEVQLEAAKVGLRYSEDNVERTIRDWLSDKSSGTAGA